MKNGGKFTISLCCVSSIVPSLVWQIFWGMSKFSLCPNTKPTGFLLHSGKLHFQASSAFVQEKGKSWFCYLFSQWNWNSSSNSLHDVAIVHTRKIRRAPQRDFQIFPNNNFSADICEISLHKKCAFTSRKEFIFIQLFFSPRMQLSMEEFAITCNYDSSISAKLIPHFHRYPESE